MPQRALGLLVALVLLLLPVGALRADAEAPTRLPVTEDIDGWDGWYGLYLAGRKSGWAHETIRRVGSGRAALWVYRLEAHIQMKVMGQVGRVAFGEMSVFEGRPPYRFLRGVSYHDEGDNRREIRVANGADALRAHITEGGTERVRAIDAVDYTFADYTTVAAWIRQAPAVGDQVRVRGFSIDDVAPDVVTFTVDSRAEDVFEVSSVSDRDGDNGTARLDGTGKVLSMRLGDFFEMRLEEESIAQEVEAGGDVFMQGTVPIDRPLGKPTKVRRMVVEVRGEGRDDLPDAPRQRVVRRDGKVFLELGDVHEGGFPATAEEIEQSLREETEYPITQPAVIELAREAVGDATTDREKVARLVAFVGEYVEDELMPSSLNVMELLRTPRGDCSEHALLLTALARAVGIPAREISGLMYMGDGHRAFGAHAWTEVVLDGKWVAVDPAWDQTEVDATHVTLSRTEKDQLRMMRLYGKLSFVLEALER